MSTQLASRSAESRMYETVSTYTASGSAKFMLPQSSEHTSGRRSSTWTKPLHPPDEVRAGPGRVRRAVRPDDQVAAHPGRQIEDHAAVPLADPFDDLAVQVATAASRPSVWFAHVNVHDRGACCGRVQRRRGDLLRSDRQVGMDPAAAARDRTCYERFPVHDGSMAGMFVGGGVFRLR